MAKTSKKPTKIAKVKPAAKAVKKPVKVAPKVKAKKLKKPIKKAPHPLGKKILSARSAAARSKVQIKTIFTTNAARIPNVVAVDEKGLNASEIQKFRDILSKKRDDLMAVVQRKKEDEIQTMEEEAGDEADVATRSVEREMLFELTDSEKQTIDMIEAALRKIETGMYGRCESCQKFIARMRIEVMPWARYCISCQSQQEIPTPPVAAPVE